MIAVVCVHCVYCVSAQLGSSLVSWVGASPALPARANPRPALRILQRRSAGRACGTPAVNGGRRLIRPAGRNSVAHGVAAAPWQRSWRCHGVVATLCAAGCGAPLRMDAALTRGGAGGGCPSMFIDVRRCWTGRVQCVFMRFLLYIATSDVCSVYVVRVRCCVFQVECEMVGCGKLNKRI